MRGLRDLCCSLLLVASGCDVDDVRSRAAVREHDAVTHDASRVSPDGFTFQNCTPAGPPPCNEGSVRGSYTLAFSHTDGFAFEAAGTRSVTLTSTGPGPITIRGMRVEPDDGAFVVQAFGASDDPFTSWPRAFPVGGSIRFDVTWSGAEAEATLLVDLATPEPDTLPFALR